MSNPLRVFPVLWVLLPSIAFSQPATQSAAANSEQAPTAKAKNPPSEPKPQAPAAMDPKEALQRLQELGNHIQELRQNLPEAKKQKLNEIMNGLKRY